MNGSGGMNVSRCCIRSSTSITIDPFQPVFSTMTGTVSMNLNLEIYSRCGQVLQVICDWKTLTFCSSKEVLHDRICIVAERNFDWSFETMNISIVAGSLICLMFSHQWNEFLCCPTFGLEIIIIGCWCTSVHHEIDRTSTTKNMSTWYNSSSSIKPLWWSRVVEWSSLAVKFHVSRVDTWSVNPWIVEIVLTTFDDQDL